MSSITPDKMMPWMIGMGAASSVASGVSGIRGGIAEQGAYNANADLILQQTQQEQEASREEFSRLMGTQRSLYAKAGVDITSGSPLLTFVDTAFKAQKQSQRIKAAGTAEANNQRYYGRLAAYRGTINGIGTMMTGLTTAASDYYKWKEGA